MISTARVGIIQVNPLLDPTPQTWWVDSFDYYYAFPLTSGKTHGPFYRVGGSVFDPEVGVPSEIDSERHCFFSLFRPNSREEARKALDLRDNPCEYVHEFYVEVPNGEHRAQLYVGPVRNGTALQANANRVVVDLIKKHLSETKTFGLPG